MLKSLLPLIYKGNQKYPHDCIRYMVGKKVSEVIRIFLPKNVAFKAGFAEGTLCDVQFDTLTKTVKLKLLKTSVGLRIKPSTKYFVLIEFRYIPDIGLPKPKESILIKNFEIKDGIIFKLEEK